MRQRGGLAQDLAELHHPSARLTAASLAAGRHGEDLRPASLMGDPITGQQLLPGLDRLIEIEDMQSSIHEIEDMQSSIQPIIAPGVWGLV